MSAVQVMGVRAARVPGMSRWITGPVAAVMIVLLAAIAAWMRLDATARDTLWAEDGRLFLASAASGSQAATLLHPYAGYLHLIPRLEAIVTVDVVPLEWWALSMTALSCLAAGVVAAVVFLATRDVVGWMPARVVIALLTVLTPLASREVLGNAANLHSLLFWGVFWVMLAVPRSRTGQLGYAIFVLLAALTEIQVVFLLPMVLWRLRDRRTWAVKAVLVAGALAQLGTALTIGRASDGYAQDSPLSIAEGWVINAVASSWVPIPRLGEALATQLPLVMLLVVVPIGAIAVTMVFGTSRQRAVSGMLLAGSVVVWCAGVVLDPAPWYEYAGMTPQQLTAVWLSRYGVVPAMMLLAEVVLAAAVLARHPRRVGTSGALSVRGVVAAGLLAALAVPLLLQAPENLSRRAEGPAWEPQLSAAAERCEAPGLASTAVRETIGWSMPVPCRYFDDLARGSDATIAVSTILHVVDEVPH